MADQVRLLLIDDHALFREGLVRLIQSEPGLTVVGHTDSLDQALALLAETEVDIILLDYDLGAELGTNLLAGMAALKTPPKVLLVTAGMTPRAAREALEAGAVGVVLKHSGPQHLIQAIRQASVIDINLAGDRTMLQLPARYPESATLSLQERPLTRRQAKALSGILEGLSNREIGAQMNISESSVKSIVQGLFDKAGVRTRAQLVRIAIEKHLTDAG